VKSRAPYTYKRLTAQERSEKYTYRETMLEHTPESLVIIDSLKRGGFSYRQMVDYLNEEKVPTARGGDWHIRTVQLAVKAIEAGSQK
jgi:hypothetical protein